VLHAPAIGIFTAQTNLQSGLHVGHCLCTFLQAFLNLLPGANLRLNEHRFLLGGHCLRLDHCRLQGGIRKLGGVLQGFAPVRPVVVHMRPIGYAIERGHGGHFLRAVLGECQVQRHLFCRIGRHREPGLFQHQFHLVNGRTRQSGRRRQGGRSPQR